VFTPVLAKQDVPKHLARRVKVCAPTLRSRSSPRGRRGAFPSAFKELDPIPQFKATAKLASFLELATGFNNS
jgi:hypothetical protein